MWQGAGGPDRLDPYAVLGVRPDADAAALRTAHRDLIRRHHPDLVPPPERAAATRRVQDLNVAYGLLRDRAARARHDALRAERSEAERAHRAGRATAARLADLDRRWEELATGAGRWAGRWWRRNRAPIARAAVRAGGTARRAAADTLGRVLWLGACLAGAVIGFLLATAVTRLTGVAGELITAVGLIAGALAGSDRGWRLRLRMAGVRAEGRAGRLATPLAGAALAAALGVELLLARG